MDRYGADVLAKGHPSPGHARRAATDLPADTGLVVEDVETGFCGAVLRVERSGGLEVVVLVVLVDQRAAQGSRGAGILVVLGIEGLIGDQDGLHDDPGGAVLCG